MQGKWRFLWLLLVPATGVGAVAAGYVVLPWPQDEAPTPAVEKTLLPQAANAASSSATNNPEPVDPDRPKAAGKAVPRAPSSVMPGTAAEYAALPKPSEEITSSSGARIGAAQNDEDVKPSAGIDVARISGEGASVIAGHAKPEANVTVLADGIPVGTTTADDRGDWVLVTPHPFGNLDPSLTVKESAVAAAPSKARGRQQIAHLKTARPDIDKGGAADAAAIAGEPDPGPGWGREDESERSRSPRSIDGRPRTAAEVTEVMMHRLERLTRAAEGRSKAVERGVAETKRARSGKAPPARRDDGHVKTPLDPPRAPAAYGQPATSAPATNRTIVSAKEKGAPAVQVSGPTQESKVTGQRPAPRMPGTLGTPTPKTDVAVDALSGPEVNTDARGLGSGRMVADGKAIAKASGRSAARPGESGASLLKVPQPADVSPGREPKPERARTQVAIMSPDAAAAPAPRGDGSGGTAMTTPGSAPLPVPVQFVYRRDVFTATGARAARLLLKYFLAKGFKTVTLSGHADERGTRRANFDLSLARLKRLERYLREGGFSGQLVLQPKGELEKYTGVDRSRFAIEELYQLDRRVELVAAR